MLLSRAAIVAVITAVFVFTAYTQTTRYKVENSSATYEGSIDSNHSSFSDSGFCNSPFRGGVTVQFTLTTSGAGTVTLDIRYTNSNPVERPANIIVNGGVLQSDFAFDNTGGQNRWTICTLTVPLNAGSNTIWIVATTGVLANINYLDVTIDGTTQPQPQPQPGARPMKNLGRGVVVVHANNTAVLVSWRLLGLDLDGIGFNVYQSTGGSVLALLNSNVLTGGTNFIDSSTNLEQANTYHIGPVVGGIEQTANGIFILLTNNPVEPVVRIPIHSDDPIKFVQVGNLTDDGEYNFVLNR